MKTNHGNKHLALVMVVAAGICWGVIGIFTRQLASMGLSAVQITLARCVITALALTLTMALTNPQGLKINWRDLWLFLGSGILSIAFFNICYFMCIQVSTLSVAAILLYTGPCFVTLMSALFFKEALTRAKLISLVMAFTGCALAVGIFMETPQTTLFGALVGIGSGFGYALYSIFGKVALKKYSGMTVTTYTFIFASVALLPFGDPVNLAMTVTSETLGIASALVLGLGSTLTPFLLYTKGLEQLEPSKASLLTFVEPLVATIVGIVGFGEALNVFTIGGILMIIASLVLSARDQEQGDELQPSTAQS